MLIVFCALTTSAADMRLIPSLGDARMGEVYATNVVQYIDLRVHLPPGKHQGATVVAWMYLESANNLAQLTTFAFWCPDDVSYKSPDLLAGAGGFAGSPIDLTAADGAVVFSDVTFPGYEIDHIGVGGEKGIATVAGWAENPITVSVCGNDITVQGDFTNNVRVGETTDIVVSGAGLCNVGVSQTPCYEFYQEIDGVTIEMTALSPESIVSNEFAMCVWRWRCDNSHQIYRSDIGRSHAFDVLSQVKTNNYCSAMHSTGFYKVGLTSVFQEPPYVFKMFDSRVFGRWLSDQELDRIHANGVQELTRRGLVE